MKMMHSDLSTPARNSLTARLVIIVFALVIGGAGSTVAQESEPPTEEASELIPPEQLESLVAPIALYPDDLLAQTLVAATYPLEIIQLQQWLQKYPDLEGEELAKAMEEQPWDPAIKSMAAVPEVVDRLANDIQWTTDLGNAFLAQQQDVLDAAQTMRKKAQQTGALETSEQMTVETQVVERDTIIVVQTVSPEVIYVPSYDPVVVYGAPVVYAYPPIYYPPPPPTGMLLAFCAGVMWGSYWGGSCCGCGWGGNDVYIHRENNFNNIENRQGGDWKHDPEHRGAAPYGDRRTADEYEGRTREDSRGDRENTGTRDGAGQRDGAERPSTGDRAGDGSNAGGSRDRERSSGSANRGESGRVGNREVEKGSGSRRDSGVNGGNHGSYDRSRAESSRSRGQSSLGGRSGSGRGGRR